MLLAREGREVVLFERAPRWRWRACGVFASPASTTALREVGLSEDVIAAVARPLVGMEVVSARGTRFRLDYGGTGELADSAVGFDRGALDPLLLDLAREAGASVRAGTTASIARLEPDHAIVRAEGAQLGDVRARVLVGADGLRSRIAPAAGVERRPALGTRAALTFHLAEAESEVARPEPGLARMHVLRDGYCGLAPVLGGRVNVGIVLGRSWFPRLRRDRGWAVARQILGALPERGASATDVDRPLDWVAGAMPVGHAVSRRAGDSWLLVGDAGGFLDPFTGEGLHRAIVSAQLAAEAVAGLLAGRSSAGLAGYERAMRARFGAKDAVSRLVQGFLGRPALFEYAARRLAARSHVRETMALVIGDLAPAGRALDPRYLAALLGP